MAIQFHHFPKEVVIFKNDRILIPTTRVFGKYPRVRQIYPQMKKLIFLEIWKANWEGDKASDHRGTFMWAIQGVMKLTLNSPTVACNHRTTGDHNFEYGNYAVPSHETRDIMMMVEFQHFPSVQPMLQSLMQVKWILRLPQVQSSPQKSETHKLQAAGSLSSILLRLLCKIPRSLKG